MSTQARAALVARCQFLDEGAKADLLNPDVTQTWLIAALLDIAPVLVTSVRTDHGDDSTLGAHGHAHGWAADIWCVSSETIVCLITRIARSHHIWTVGLGGAARPFLDARSAPAPCAWSWPDDVRFALFLDNSTDHIHIQAGNSQGEGLR